MIKVLIYVRFSLGGLSPNDAGWRNYMRLTKAQVTNFKCVDDSNEFSIDDVTCLVGKNEAGKTAILKSLYRINPTDSTDEQYDKQRDYPRRYLLDYDEIHKSEEATVVTTHWVLSDAEIEGLKKIVGPRGLTGNEVIVKKGYGNKQGWTVPVDEKNTVEHLIASARLHEEEAKEFVTIVSVKELRERLDGLGDKASERHKALLAHIKSEFKRGDASHAVIDYLKLPKFLYFSVYDRMNGQVALDALIQKKNNGQAFTKEEKVFNAFLGLVGITIEDLAKQNQFEPLIARLEAASIKISREVFEYWSQNQHLKVQFRLDQAQQGDPAPFNQGRVMRARVLNTHHDVTVGFDERSTGFVWFFSFLVLFSQVKKAFGDNLIILLDEPGLSLHAKAQTDLLRYFEERLKPHHQVIYTTHSPFMVPTDNLLRVRTVEDVVRQREGGGVDILGTKVGDHILSADRDTLFPLQSALGYEITQSLFIGKNTLLVEGPSDLLYLKIFSEALRAKNRTALDKRWTICPTGGVDKVSAFLTLFGGNQLNVAVLVDYAKGSKKRVDDLRRSTLLQQGRVFTANTYAGQDEGDIEDMLGRQVYVELLNKTYDLNGNSIDAAKLPAKGRVLEHVENHFRTLPPKVAEFDHYRPSLYLLENHHKVFDALPEISAAMDRFEKLFNDLNGLLA